MPNRTSLAALRSLARSAQQRSISTGEAVAERRAESRAKKITATVEKAEVPDFFLTNGGQREEKAINSTEVMAWFREGLEGLYGDRISLPSPSNWWTVGERRLSKMLLTSHGPDRVQKAVRHFCETWPKRVESSDGALGGIPTISMLWRIRDRVFAELDGVASVGHARKRTARKRDHGEWKPGPVSTGIGWEK